MTEVRILLRWFLLATAALVLCTCTARRSGAGNPCTGGVGNQDPEAPIVCVDDTGATLSVSPDPIEVHDRGKSSRQPVVIHWWTKSGAGELGIEVGEGCVTEVRCRGGHCTAKTVDIPADTPDGKVRCKYDVWTTRENRLDPDIVVTECCRV